MSIGFNRTRIISPVPVLNNDDTIVPIVYGGTGATTPLQAVKNIGGISAHRLNRPGEPAKLRPDGVFDYELFDDECGYNKTVEGPLKMYVGQTAEFFITNFSSFSYGDTQGKRKTRLWNGEYMFDGEIDFSGDNLLEQITSSTQEFNIVRPFNGGEVAMDDDKIYYTAPNKPGISGFYIGNRKYLIEVSLNGIEQPYLYVPETELLSVPIDCSFLSSKFVSGNPDDIHISTDWQISRDSLFTKIVKSSMNDEINLTGWDVFGLEKKTKYYIRVRYRTQNDVSEWSIPAEFITSNQLMGGNIQSILGEPGKRFGSCISVDDTGKRFTVCNDPLDKKELRAMVYRTHYGSYITENTITPQSVLNGYVNKLESYLSKDGNRLFVVLQLMTGVQSIEYYNRSVTDWVFGGRFVPRNFFSETFTKYTFDTSEDGRKVILGFPDNRKAYIFVNGALNNWTIEGKFELDVENYGSSVLLAKNGTMCVIGSSPNAYVYHYTDGYWKRTDIISISGVNFGDKNSFSMSKDGTTIYSYDGRTAKGYVWKYRNRNWDLVYEGGSMTKGVVNKDGTILVVRNQDTLNIHKFNENKFENISKIELNRTNDFVFDISGTGRNIVVGEPGHNDLSGVVDIFREYKY